MPTWETTITIDNLAKKHVNISAVRTDGEDVRTYSVSGVNANQLDKPLSELKTDAVNALFTKHEAEEAIRTQFADLVSGWEAALNTALEAKET